MAIQSTNVSEIRYQQAVKFYMDKGILAGLKRQWEYIQEPDQLDILTRTAVISAGTIIYCTYKGVKIGGKFADHLNLKNEEKVAVMVCGGVGGFVTGVVFTITLNGLVIEQSKRLEGWKHAKMDFIIERMMRNEYENDPILAQFFDPITQEPIFTPIRTPAGQVFNYNSLLGACDANGIIKDIYNKRVHDTYSENPDATVDIRYSIDACLKDTEMMIVIYKRFRHIATQKAREEGLSQETKILFMEWRNSLGEVVNPLYRKREEDILKKRNDIFNRPGISEEAAEGAEKIYQADMKCFKDYFGNTHLSDIDWKATDDWNKLLNERWMKEYHS